MSDPEQKPPDNPPEPEFNPDAPAPYLAALDYIAPLEKLGYEQGRPGAYRKDIPCKWIGVRTKGGFVRIRVTPQNVKMGDALDEVHALISIDYVCGGNIQRIQDILIYSLFDIVDTVSEIERMVDEEGLTGIGDLAARLRGRDFPGGSGIPSRENLWDTFHESQEDGNPDNPEFYLGDLNRHHEVVNAFLDRGAFLQKQGVPKGQEQSYLLYRESERDTSVAYVITLKPDNASQSWTVSARGMKEFTHDVNGVYVEDFAIDDIWTIQADADLEVVVDDILHELGAWRGQSEPHNQDDIDDIDESDEDKLDHAAYARSSQDYNPISLLTSKDIRGIIRSLGYRTVTAYKSRHSLGWTITVTPATPERFQAFRANEHRESEYVSDAFRAGIEKRLPAIDFERKFYYMVWPWSGATSSDPENSRNYTININLQPVDYFRRKKGVIDRRHESLPVPDPDEELNPDDPQAFINKMRAAEMGDLVLSICPHCGDRYEVIKNWPDGLKNYGVRCQKCDRFIPRGPTMALEAIEDQDDQIDKEAYAKDTLLPDNTLKSLGYQYYDNDPSIPAAHFTPHWAKDITPELQFVVFVEPDFKWQFQVYKKPPENTGEPLHTHDQVSTSGGWHLKLSSANRKLRFLKVDLIRWEKKARDNGLKFYESEEPGNVDDPSSMLSHWKNRYYMVYGRKSDEDRETVFGRFGQLSDAVVYVNKNVLCSDYEEVRITEFADSPHYPDTYSSTGVRYVFTPDGQLKDVSKPRPGSVKEAAENVDPDPVSVVSTWVKKYYILYAQTHPPARYIGMFPLVKDALDRAKTKKLCSTNTDVWITEYGQTDDPGVYNYGVQYMVTPEYTLAKPERESDKIHPKNNPGSDDTSIQVIEPIGEAHDEGDDFDVSKYSEETFDPGKFLESSGWKEATTLSQWRAFMKTFPTPWPYQIGGMIFTGIEIRIAITKESFSNLPHINASFVNAENTGFNITGWRLQRQLLYRWPYEGTDIPDSYYDTVMPIRRFVLGIGQVFDGIKWPRRSTAALLTNSKVEAAISVFVNELNNQADIPLHDRQVEETFNPDDAASFVNRMRIKPANVKSARITSTPSWRTMRVGGEIIGWYREPDPTGKHGHLTKWQASLGPNQEGDEYHYCDSEAECLAWAAMEAGTTTFDP